jgi:peptidyl-prolyl cis-trans isomerase SurA
VLVGSVDPAAPAAGKLRPADLITAVDGKAVRTIAQLRAAGIQPRVLFDQLRAQIGWGRLLRSLLGPQAEPQPSEVAETIAAARARQGQVEFLLSEIFIPVDDPNSEPEVRRFTEEVVGQLRRGLAFPVAATQFSQSQTALSGGDLGWVSERRLDPEVAGLVNRMPPGAISNAIRVAGGFQIVAMRQRREGGRESAGTQLDIRQLFIAFPGRLDPANPTDAQRAVAERASRIAQTTRGCEALEAAGRGLHSADRPMDPGPVRLEGINPPQLRSLLASLAIGRASQPVISPDGVAVIMVCAREQREVGACLGCYNFGIMVVRYWNSADIMLGSSLLLIFGIHLSGVHQLLMRRWKYGKYICLKFELIL